ncbi:hypothetical protein WR25_00441 [Diploscapter pachys]|uniref:Uncharacterized protein n=1 Tax=Diploscapter pachys TaxID=2018661 RepID=A0A2A2KBY1_9BILA|nr:hypothetical protein WR25_00441 [Diploscapter pachys]
MPSMASTAAFLAALMWEDAPITVSVGDDAAGEPVLTPLIAGTVAGYRIGGGRRWSPRPSPAPAGSRATPPPSAASSGAAGACAPMSRGASSLPHTISGNSAIRPGRSRASARYATAAGRGRWSSSAGWDRSPTRWRR